MGTFQTFIDSKGITPRQIATTSRRIETLDEAGRALMGKRFTKRNTKDTADKKYAELNIDKPQQLGRGVSEKAVAAAAREVPVARKVRSKILRAVNALLVKKGQAAADMKALFEGTKARPGKKKAEEKKK